MPRRTALSRGMWPDADFFELGKSATCKCQNAVDSLHRLELLQFPFFFTFYSLGFISSIVWGGRWVVCSKMVMERDTLLLSWPPNSHGLDDLGLLGPTTRISVVYKTSIISLSERPIPVIVLARSLLQLSLSFLSSNSSLSTLGKSLSYYHLCRHRSLGDLELAKCDVHNSYTGNGLCHFGALDFPITCLGRVKMKRENPRKSAEKTCSRARLEN